MTQRTYSQRDHSGPNTESGSLRPRTLYMCQEMDHCSRTELPLSRSLCMRERLNVASDNKRLEGRTSTMSIAQVCHLVGTQMLSKALC